MSDKFSLKNNFSYMRNSRIIALQILYQIEFFNQKEPFEKISKKIYHHYLTDHLKDNIDDVINQEFVKNIIKKSIEKKTEILEEIKPLLQRSLDDLSLNLKLILILAISEILINKTDLKIIYNEYIEITKVFENDEDAKFVNSILANIATKLSTDLIEN